PVGGPRPPQGVVARRAGRGHGPAARGELERVRDEVVEYLPQPRGVGFQREAAFDVEAELDPVLCGSGAGILHRRGRQLGEVGRRGPKLEPLSLDLRNQEEVLDDAAETIVAATDDVDVSAACRAELMLLVCEQLEEARDRGE